jgi:hypothetical protein
MPIGLVSRVDRFGSSECRFHRAAYIPTRPISNGHRKFRTCQRCDGSTRTQMNIRRRGAADDVRPPGRVSVSVHMDTFLFPLSLPQHRSILSSIGRDGASGLRILSLVCTTNTHSFSYCGRDFTYHVQGIRWLSGVSTAELMQVDTCSKFVTSYCTSFLLRECSCLFDDMHRKLGKGTSSFS